MGASSSVAFRSVGLRCFEFKRFASVALTALCGGVAVLLLCLVASASAQDADGVTFENVEPLSLSWAQLVNGRRIELCNGSAASISRFHVVPVGFSFKRATAAAKPAEVIAVRRLRGKLPAGGCAPVLIDARSKTPIDAGEYSGELLLTAAGGGSARLALKVAYPAADSEGPPAATEPANASIRSATPFSETGDAKLLLKQSSAAEAELSAASACHGAQAESDACFIGNLYRGTRALGVWVSGPVSVGDHVLELPIRLKGSSHPVGAYEGSVTLPGTSRPIKLKLTAEDGWWCAVIALLIGAGLALIGQLWNGHTRPKHALLARNRALISQYGADPLARHAHIRPDESDVLDYTEELQSAIRLYAASVVMLDEKSAAYAAIERALKLAEDDASVFKGALAPALDRLAAETQLTIKMLNGKQVSDVPQILRQAADLLGARELRVGEATQRAKQAEQLAPLLAAWRNLATRILTNAVWLKALEGKLRPRRSAQAKAELSELVYAGIELNAVRTSLFESTDEAELATIRTSVPLAQALGRIALTASRQDVKEPADNTSPSEVAGDLERVAYDAPQGSALTETTVEKARAKADVRRARPAALPSRRPWVLVGDSLVLLFTFGASIVAGLSTFYFNKTFGSAEDYLTVIVIGTAAQTLLKVVLNQTSVLLHDISPDMPVVPARVLPPAPAAAMALATPTGAGDGRRRRDAKLQTSDQVN